MSGCVGISGYFLTTAQGFDLAAVTIINGNFGGERYKSSTWGSHGCINMPLDKAKYVYDKIDMGTPVFMYW